MLRQRVLTKGFQHLAGVKAGLDVIPDLLVLRATRGFPAYDRSFDLLWPRQKLDDNHSSQT